MKAAVLLGPSHVEVRDVDAPTLSESEVMIQPLRAGVCGSDVSLYVGHRQPPYVPFILGHEVVARVVAVAPGVTKVAVGQRVIVEPNYTCGVCRFCRAGRGNICPNKRSTGVSVPGIFADYAAIPAEFTWPVPDTISDADAATIEPLAVSLHALLQSGARAGDTVAVVGCGVVGLLLIHVAVAKGVRVLAHDLFPEKLEMAVRLGATVSAAEDVAALWKEENVSTVFECAGVASTTELSIGSAPRGSTVMLLGLSTAPASFVPLRLVREGIRIEPSLIYDHPGDFTMAISLVAERTLAPASIVTDTMPFGSIGPALEIARTGKAGKVHVTFA
jgi:L-iditol 2-dehydrogenase